MHWGGGGCNVKEDTTASLVYKRKKSFLFWKKLLRLFMRVSAVCPSALVLKRN